MANIPQKTKDATEEALTAIQEALSIRPNETRPAPSSFGPAEPNPADAQTPREPGDLFAQDGSVAWPAGDSAPRRAANDDRAGIGQILQALGRRPSRGPYVAAGVAGIVWAAVSIAALYAIDTQAVFGTATLGFAAMLAIGGAIGVPIVFFFVLAHMFNRAQDMRVVAESMAEVAMRLAQPETVARESIVTVGQAIRREVAAMGDGVERALARAAELEALVHNEVSALERAYNDNEVRIRDLLTELSNQRETLVTQAEQVRNAIASVHLDLAHDITSVGDLVADKVNEVAQRVTRSLTEKGEHITLALGHAGDSMIDALSERGSTLLDRLETTSDQATTAISSASDRLSASLSFKTEHVHDEFAELAARLQQMMTARLDQVAQSFAQRSATTIESMASRSQQLTEAITETSNRLAESIAAHGEDVPLPQPHDVALAVVHEVEPPRPMLAAALVDPVTVPRHASPPLAPSRARPSCGPVADARRAASALGHAPIVPASMRHGNGERPVGRARAPAPAAPEWRDRGLGVRAPGE